MERWRIDRNGTIDGGYRNLPCPIYLDLVDMYRLCDMEEEYVPEEQTAPEERNANADISGARTGISAAQDLENSAHNVMVHKVQQI